MTARYLVAGIVLATVCAVPAFCRITDRYASTTDAVRIGGRRYVTDSQPTERRRPGSPVFAVDARDAGIDGGARIALPQGLFLEETLTLSGPGGPTTIAFGTMAAPASSVRERLRAASWSAQAPAAGADCVEVATITTGKETRVVFLDEKERRFLALRRVEE